MLSRHLDTVNKALIVDQLFSFDDVSDATITVLDLSKTINVLEVVEVI